LPVGIAVLTCEGQIERFPEAEAEKSSPNRLRHSAGTEICKRYRIESAQVILGHASADVTQVDAERDLQRAAEIMREVG
jgi:site-specific recombinase XerC